MPTKFRSCCKSAPVVGAKRRSFRDDPRAREFTLAAQKTMYGGKHIAVGDKVFVFASENEGGRGLIARGVVTSVSAVS